MWIWLQPPLLLLLLLFLSDDALLILFPPSRYFFFRTATYSKRETVKRRQTESYLRELTPHLFSSIIGEMCAALPPVDSETPVHNSLVKKKKGEKKKRLCCEQLLNGGAAVFSSMQIKVEATFQRERKTRWSPSVPAALLAS
jgi:hypothetical protein